MEKIFRFGGIFLVGAIFPFLVDFPDSDYLTAALFSTFYTFLSWHACIWIFHFVLKKYPDLQQLMKRILIEYILITIIIVFINSGCALVIDFLIMQEDFTPKEVYLGWRITLLALIFSYGVTAVYEGVYFLNQLTAKIIETEKLKSENIQSQFEVLKNQVNPHFLFNSLNTLAAIIPENPVLAVDFTQKLSAVYRYILQNKDKELVPLSTELEFVQAYIFLQKIRFGDNFRVNININEKYKDTFVAPLTLQMLVENAVKHNIISTEKPLFVDISIEKDTILLVKNNLQQKKISEQSTRLGLQNIINRYKYLSDQAVDVIVTASNFIVALPLITMPGD